MGPLPHKVGATKGLRGSAPRLAKRFSDFPKNFGEFFLDQIENAQTVILSRTDVAYDKVNEALEIIRNHNQKL